MTWVDLLVTLATGVSVSRSMPVSIGCSKPGRWRQTVRITVRPVLLDGGVPWWTLDQVVRVQIGGGDHAGQLRLSPVGPGRGVKLIRSGGPTKGLVALSLIAFPVLRATQRQPPESVEFDHGEDWIELTLPAWAISPAAGVKPQPAAETKLAVQPLVRPAPDSRFTGPFAKAEGVDRR